LERRALSPGKQGTEAHGDIPGDNNKPQENPEARKFGQAKKSEGETGLRPNTGRYCDIAAYA
jgi:hypothetical protein